MNRMSELIKDCSKLLSSTTVTVVSSILENSYILLPLTLHLNNVGQVL